MTLSKLLKTKITRENFVLVGVLLILAAIPLTVILLGIRQELRKRAVGVDGAILINNGAETTNSPNVTLTLTAPSEQQSFLKIPQAYAANYCGGNCSSKSGCPATCIRGTTEYYNLGGCSSSFRCYYGNTRQLSPTEVPTPTPLPNSVDERCSRACRNAGYAQGLCKRVNCGCDSQMRDPTVRCGEISKDYCEGRNPYESYNWYHCCCYGGEEPLDPASEGCSNYCKGIGKDGGKCMTGCSSDYSGYTNWSGCDSGLTCCCSKNEIPIPPVHTEDGCILNCSPSKGFSGCSLTMTTDEPYIGCRYYSDGRPHAYGGCLGSGLNYCSGGPPGRSGQHTETVRAFDGPQGTGNVVATCSDSFVIDCSFANQPPVCSGISGPDQVEPGGEAIFTVSASDPDSGDSSGIGWMVSWFVGCGGEEPASVGRVGDSFEWSAPLEPVTCTITAKVTDGYYNGQTECPDKTVQVGESGPGPTTTPTPGGPTPTPTPPAGVQAMMISNYENFQGAVEESFTTTKSWTLTEGDGLKTVWAKFKVGGVWTTPVSDSITLDTGVGPTPTPTLPPNVTPTPTPTLPPGTPTPTPTPPPGGYLKLDLLKVWFWKQEKSLGRGHEGAIILALKQGGNVVLEKAVQLDENGEARNVELPGVAAGTHDAFVYEPGYLTKKLSNVPIGTSGNELDFTKGGAEYFLVGDFNGDQEVNILDFSIFVKSYGKSGEE